MNLQTNSQTQINTPWPGVFGTTEPFTDQGVSDLWGEQRISASVSVSSSVENKQRQIEAFISDRPENAEKVYREFQGRLVIPDIGKELLLQKFQIIYDGKVVRIESLPSGNWPKVSFEFASNLEKGNEVSLEVSQPIQSVDAILLYTRLIFLLLKGGRFILVADGIGELIGFEVPSTMFDLETLLRMSRLARKLKFIQRVFNVTFDLSSDRRFSLGDIKKIDIIFRGITEGEFFTRSESITFFKVKLSRSGRGFIQDNSDGPFYIRMEGESNFQELFGRKLEVGPITVEIPMAEWANQREVLRLVKAGGREVDIKLSALDHQIKHRFEKYADIKKGERARKLKRFIYDLSCEEPEELARLVTEPLVRDVPSDEAVQIAFGWLQYNRLPDRFCPQEPELDQTAGCWRVPIWLVYTSGEGGEVGELLIDVKTGKIISHSPVEEMKRRAKPLADQILNVSETAPSHTGD
ncbi:MAG TPA: hypothetical protein VFD58_16675 [Blastocatellia bacterium]|nr:hypothetical protein [Blastocatellia bacterium]